MSAQIPDNLREGIRTALGLIVSDLKDAKAHNVEGRDARGKLATHLRQYAGLTADAGIATTDAQTVLAGSLKAAKVPAGTVKVYSGAFKGYRQAMAEGVNIEDVSNGEAEKPQPMTVPKAREFLIPAAERAEKARFDTIRAEIAERVRAVTDYAELVAFRDMLPEAEGATTTREPSVDEQIEAMLAAVAPEGAQPARRAAVH